MSEGKNSAIYAGLDDEKTTQLGKSAGASDEQKGLTGADAPDAPAAPSAGPNPSPKRGAGLKAAIAVLAVASAAIIGVSVFALAGGFEPEGTQGVAPEAAQGSASAVADQQDADGQSEDASVDEAGQDQAASDTQASSAAQGGSTDSGSKDAAGSGGGQAGGSESSNVSEPAAPQPARLTVSVVVDSSVVGSPVSLSTTVTLEEGATAYDALVATGLSVNARPSQYGLYVAAIGGLAEDPAHGVNGWTYYVNGSYINKAASGTVLSDGDTVQWIYVVGDK